MKSFKYAFLGVIECIRSERNMRIHLCFVFYVLLAGAVTALSAAEWAAILICCGLVTGFECVNTAMERACDAVTKEQNSFIKKAKDAAAGAVLVSAIASAAVGCIVFFSKGRPRAALDFFLARPVLAVLLIFSLALWLIFIFGRKGK